MARHVGTGVEASYASLATVDRFAEAISETVTTVREFEDVTTIRSDALLTSSLLRERIEGDVTMTGNYQDIDPFLYSIFGSVDSVTTTTTQHDFPASTGFGTQASLTLEVQRDTAALTTRYLGMIVERWAFTFGADQTPQSTFGMVGKSGSRGTATSSTFPTFDPMLISDASFSLNSGTHDVTAVSFEMARPVDRPHTIGNSQFQLTPTVNDVVSVTGSATLIITDATELDLYDGSSDVDIAIALTDGTHSMTVNMDKVRLTAFPHNLDGRNRLTGTVEWTSIFNTTATQNIQVVLVNDQTDPTA